MAGAVLRLKNLRRNSEDAIVGPVGYPSVPHFGARQGPCQQAARLLLRSWARQQRAERRKAHQGNLEAAAYLYELPKSRKEEEQVQKSAADQLVVVATVAPRRYRAKYHQGQFQGPSARKDAEEAEMHYDILNADACGQAVTRTTK